MVANKQHRAWEEDALWQLKKYKPLVNYPASMTCIFTMKDNRHRDLDNCLTSVQDVLMKAGILKADDWQSLRPITIDCAGVDKTDPKVEIWFDD